MIDYPSFRVGTEHEETPKHDDTWCEVCGWVEDLDPSSLAAKVYHGDSFGIELTIEEHEELQSMRGVE
jgi:hypothetical protein